MPQALRRAAAALLALALLAPLPAAAESRVPQSLGEIDLTFAPVVQAAAPAVVNIYARREVETRRNPFADDPFFRRFFDELLPRGRQVQNSLGSGVIVSPDGLVVSNNHVVGGADEIRVVLHDRREFDAEVVLTDPDSDLAVLRLEGAEGLPTLPLRDSDTVEVGDLVLAIGNPFGVGQTVTSGIISAAARTRRTPDGGPGYYLQTDAAINPGNSGGALVDTAGRLVGVNTAILSRTGGSIGIGFAIPANLVRQVVAQAAEGRSELTRPWSGLDVQPMDGPLAEAMGLDLPQGLVIAEAHPRSPFAEAGLGRGDVLLSVGGRPVGTQAELDFRLAALGVGREAEIVYLREGEERRAGIELIAAPEQPPRDVRRLPGPTPMEGLKVANLNPALAAEIGAPATASGVVVLDLPRAAARAGFRKGDLIRAINGEPVADTAALERIARRAPERLEIAIERDGRRGALRFSR
ncbi:MAG: trypsin-like peptidase domain-containing protein [Pseudomonadota bacterium]